MRSLNPPKIREFNYTKNDEKYTAHQVTWIGPPARRQEGAYLNRYVTDEQRSRRPISGIFQARARVNMETTACSSWFAAPAASISSAARLPRRPAVVGRPSRTNV